MAYIIYYNYRPTTCQFTVTGIPTCTGITTKSCDTSVYGTVGEQPGVLGNYHCSAAAHFCSGCACSTLLWVH